MCVATDIGYESLRVELRVSKFTDGLDSYGLFIKRSFLEKTIYTKDITIKELVSPAPAPQGTPILGTTR